jgi:hypothetical protein
MLLRCKSACVKTMGMSSSNPERQGPRSTFRLGGAPLLSVASQSLNAATAVNGPAGCLSWNMTSSKGSFLMSPTDAASLSLLEILVQRTDEWGTCILFEQAQILEKVILRVKELIKARWKRALNNVSCRKRNWLHLNFEKSRSIYANLSATIPSYYFEPLIAGLQDLITSPSHLRDTPPQTNGGPYHQSSPSNGRSPAHQTIAPSPQAQSNKPTGLDISHMLPPRVLVWKKYQ